MNIAAAAILKPNGVNAIGAFVATNKFLQALTEAGHTVTYTNDPDGSHVAVSNYGDPGKLHRAAVAAGVPSIRMVHSPPSDGGIGFRGAALAVANSHATARLVLADVPKVICHPPVDVKRFKDVRPGDRVTLVNLSRAKGSEMFWQLAKRMPDVNFLGVRGGHGVQVVPKWNLSNVDVWEPQPDIRNVLSATRVLLMPSLRESFGIVAVEAMSAGIPVVANPTRGLKEACGDAPVWLTLGDWRDWKKEIDRLLTDRFWWRDRSTVGRKRAAELDSAKSLRRFVAAVEALAQ